MILGDRTIAPDHPPYIIAELGVNHDGSLDRAFQLVHSARRAGADAIKLQFFQAGLLMSRACHLAQYQQSAGETDPLQMLRRLELPLDQLAAILTLAHQLRLHAILTIFSVELVQPAASLHWDAFKTASPDIINQPLLQSLKSLNKPLLVSTGASSLDELRRAAHWLHPHHFTFLQCVSAYPTPLDRAALAARLAIHNAGLPALGYSDHTPDTLTGALAVASGACLLEKHLTYDRSAAGPDHAASLDEPAFAEYVALAHRAFRALGPPQKRVLDIELDVRAVSRQSLVSAHDLRAGSTIARRDLTIKRPGTGIPPFDLPAVLTRTLARDVPADTPLAESDLA